MSGDINASSTVLHNNTHITTTDDSSRHIEELALVGLLSVVSLVTVIGNTLVILAVLTTRRLRTVTNCFVMSLAVADFLVGIIVLPLAIVYRVMGIWDLGKVLCDIWVSLDILLCTASILSLCAISVDRYLAVTQPLSYSRRRRSKRLAFSMILIVWTSSALITCPPMFGWSRHSNLSSNSTESLEKECTYNDNPGYVIFSAMGSFFIPMVVMLYVYARISCVVAQRHDQLASIDRQTRKSQKLVPNAKEESDIDRGSSECEEHNLRCTSISPLKPPRPPLLLNPASFSSGISTEPLSQNNHNDARKTPGHSTRSLRSNLNYSFTPEPATPQRSASLYRTTSLSTNNRSRPESLNLDVSVLNYEPATRVSSFRRETKTAQTLSIVVGGFVACWLPFFTYYLLRPFLSSVNEVVFLYLTWLGWINSAINPFIYAFYSPDFRIAFWRLTFKHFSKSRRAEFAFQHK